MPAVYVMNADLLRQQIETRIWDTFQVNLENDCSREVQVLTKIIGLKLTL